MNAPSRILALTAALAAATPLLALADATPLQGGVPVLVDGKVVGAVGVSGDTPLVDEEIALAGAKAIR